MRAAKGQGSSQSADLVAAGRLERLVAFLIDFAVVFILPLWTLGAVTLWGMSRGEFEEVESVVRVTFVVVAAATAVTIAVLGVLYRWLMIAIRGQTIGKRLMKIKVVRPDGKPPGLATAALRELVGKHISTAFFLGYIWILGEQRRGWHDLIAETYVVRV